MQHVIQDFVARGLMRDPRGLTVWDLGCGDGIFSRALLELGAARVIASDIIDIMPRELLDDRRIDFEQGGFDAVIAKFGEHGVVPADVVFMHLMTEHVEDLRGFFRSLHACLRPGAEIFVHHDNYYQPVGTHDHGLLFLDESTWTVEPQGVRCWEHPAKCAASEAHRATLLKRQWNESDATRDPSNCEGCNYFRRSRPWAHLHYANEFLQTYPEREFREEINYATPDQVRLLCHNAGFVIAAEDRSWIMNPVPEDLVPRYGQMTLSTFTITLRAAKP